MGGEEERKKKKTWDSCEKTKARYRVYESGRTSEEGNENKRYLLRDDGNWKVRDEGERVENISIRLGRRRNDPDFVTPKKLIYDTRTIKKPQTHNPCNTRENVNVWA